MKATHRRGLLLLALLFIPATLWAQGVTTAALTGTVTDTNGEPLPGANIVAVHEPTGTDYGTTANIDGRFNIFNMRAGGPYTVTVSFIGFQTTQETDLSLTLGQTRELSFTLQESTVELAEVQVLGQTSSVLNSERTGASTNVNQETIERMPTISRSLSDFARLSPHASSTGDATSFAGRNNRFNNITIDGATLNDVFGLTDSGLPTGQAGAQPISLDAIEEFNVDIAPYDIRYSGFTGGSINAVTRSGTNTFEGSVRYLGRNQALVGDSPTGEPFGEFDEQFFVGTLGGPIIQNELFFFANVEYVTRNTPLDVGIPGSGAGNIFPVSPDTLQRIIDIARDQYGYDPGGFGAYSEGRNNLKLLGKLDWNLHPEHRLTLRYNYVDAQQDDGVVRSARSFDLENRRFLRDNVTQSAVAELRSTLGTNAFNEARVVYTRVRDQRDVQAEPFPYVAINVTDDEAVYLGIDRFSQANSLDQDLIELTNNLTLARGNHTFLLGTSNQFFHFNNLFIQDYYGGYEFASIDDFAAGAPARYFFSYSLLDDPQPQAEVSALQLGFYAQDEWAVSPTVTLTAGLRFDVPFFLDEPLNNVLAAEAFPGYSTTNTAGGNILWSPRFGFNWDVSGGMRTTQLRGGTGIFSGRTPYVWISNQYSNTGVDFARVDVRDLPPGFFEPTPDPSEQPRPDPDDPDSPLAPVQTTEINLIDEDFRFPQVWRSSVALDQQLPWGVIGTLEGIYSQSINDVTYRNLNLKPTSISAYGRPIYGEAGFFGNENVRNENFTNAILLENTDLGYEYSLSAVLQKTSTTGLNGMLAYTYSRAENVNNVTSSRAISNWQYNENLDVNNPRLGTADFEVRHRVLANLSYRIGYLDGRFATTVGLFYEGRSGEPFSWIYNGNANGDTRNDNDLIYVPARADEIILTSNNWDALDAFIASEDDLDDARGSVITRNSARSPWRNILDLNLTQQIYTVSDQRVELTANVLNVLNLLGTGFHKLGLTDGRTWSEIQYPNFNNYRLLDFEGYVGDDDVGTTIAGREITDDDIGKPIVSFDEVEDRDDLFLRSNLASRWQMQFGIRYVF